MNLSNHAVSKKNSGFTDFARMRSSLKLRTRKSNSGEKDGLLSKSGKKSTGGNQSRVRRITKRVFTILGLIFLFSTLIGVLGAIGVVSYYSKELPNVDEYFAESKTQGKDTIIVDRNGKELYRLQGDIVADQVSINETPKNMQFALIAAEDGEFLEHRGLNLFGLTRAFTCAARNGGQALCGGGSSITQQVLKNTALKNEDGMTRKIKEAVLAMQSEQEYDKDEILELYINILPQGGIYRGVKTGSKAIYGQEDLNKLSLAQMAFLAAIPNEPTTLSPLGGSAFDREKSEGRAVYVLDRMYTLSSRPKIKEKFGGISEEEYKKAKEELSTVVFQKPRVDIKAPHFVNYILEDLDERYKDKVDVTLKERGRDYLRGKGHTIVTTVDLETQEMLEENMRTQIDSAAFQKDIAAQTGAAVMMDPKTGEVRALIGSKNFFGEPDSTKKFSPQADEARSVKGLGSTVKPILSLSALENGYNPSTSLPNFAVNMNPGGAPYNIKNFGPAEMNYADVFSGRKDFITMRTGLKYSLNIPAVATYHLIGAEKYTDTYERLTGWKNENFRSAMKNPSSAIGAANLPLIEQVHAYATMASEGMYYEKKIILEIKDANGTVVFNNREVKGKQVVEKKYAYLINDMNKNFFLFGTDPLLVELGKKGYIGGKTGTADNDDEKTSDLSFVAYTPNMVLGMWTGNSCGLKCPIKQGVDSKKLYDLLYKPFLQNYKDKLVMESYKTRPKGVEEKVICNLSGRQATGDCEGGTHKDIVADTANLKEEMFQKAWVVQCGDRELLARDSDKAIGLAQEKKYFSYKFTNKAIEKFINDRGATLGNSGIRRPPTETCDKNLSQSKPQVNIVSPTNGATYKQSDSLNIQIFVTSDIPLRRVELFVNNNLVRSFDSGPYETTISLNSGQYGIKNGSNTISVIARDQRDNDQGETRSDVTFNVNNSGGGGGNSTPTPTPSTTGTILFPIGITTTPTDTPPPSNGSGKPKKF